MSDARQRNAAFVDAPIAGPSHQELRAPFQKSLQQIADEQQQRHRQAVQQLEDEQRRKHNGK